jgi:hypothetical protein
VNRPSHELPADRPHRPKRNAAKKSNEESLPIPLRCIQTTAASNPESAPVIAANACDRRMPHT